MKFRGMLDKDTMEFAQNGRPWAAVLRSKRDLIAILLCRTYGCHRFKSLFNKNTHAPIGCGYFGGVRGI